MQSGLQRLHEQDRHYVELTTLPKENTNGAAPDGVSALRTHALASPYIAAFSYLGFHARPIFLRFLISHYVVLVA
jgi:hypothetical protein